MNQENVNQKLAQWNDRMVEKYHTEGTPSESKNIFLRIIERMRLKKIIQSAQLRKNDIILDLGCGEGFLISLMPEFPKKIVGLDISQVALKRAKEVLKGKKNVEFRLGNAESLDFFPESFDKVICSEMLEHVPHPRQVMREMHKILKKDGFLTISVPDEKRIQFIMKIAKIIYLDKILGACRKGEKYEWHLHQADRKFITDISQGLFEVKKICRIPPFIGYHFIATLVKK